MVKSCGEHSSFPVLLHVLLLPFISLCSPLGPSTPLLPSLSPFHLSLLSRLFLCSSAPSLPVLLNSSFPISPSDPPSFCPILISPSFPFPPSVPAPLSLPLLPSLGPHPPLLLFPPVCKPPLLAPTLCEALISALSPSAALFAAALHGALSPITVTQPGSVHAHSQTHVPVTPFCRHPPRSVNAPPPPTTHY